VSEKLDCLLGNFALFPCAGSEFHSVFITREGGVGPTYRDSVEQSVLWQGATCELLDLIGELALVTGIIIGVNYSELLSANNIT
jgi:hypothetical protein